MKVSTLLAAGAVVCCAVQPAAAAILITVSWTYVTTEISPLQTTHSSTESSSFAMEGNKVMSPTQATAAFGQSAAGVNGYGSAFRASYRISGGRVVETLRFAGSTTVITVATNGSDSCSATVRFLKAPGKRYFEGDRQGTGEHMLMSDEHAEDVVCSITRQ